eukprot:922-Heterococcus_DN1.PRE.3
MANSDACIAEIRLTKFAVQYMLSLCTSYSSQYTMNPFCTKELLPLSMLMLCHTTVLTPSLTAFTCVICEQQQATQQHRDTEHVSTVQLNRQPLAMTC